MSKLLQTPKPRLFRRVGPTRLFKVPLHFLFWSRAITKQGGTGDSTSPIIPVKTYALISMLCLFAGFQGIPHCSRRGRQREDFRKEGGLWKQFRAEDAYSRLMCKWQKWRQEDSNSHEPDSMQKEKLLPVSHILSISWRHWWHATFLGQR